MDHLESFLFMDIGRRGGRGGGWAEGARVVFEIDPGLTAMWQDIKINWVIVRPANGSTPISIESDAMATVLVGV